MTTQALAAPPGAGEIRLLAGWRETGEAAGLREHAGRYGRLPLRGRRRGQRPGPLARMAADAGLTGRGGAGFPTGTKLSAVAEQGADAVVVANGMESEPASEKDQVLLSLAPHLVLDGLVLAAEAVGATAAHVCLPRSRPWLVDQVADAVAARRRARWDPVPVQVHALPHYYVSSEETALVRWLNGGEAKPLGSPPRPFERGVGKRPTLIDNAETLAHLALIGRYGPAWFRAAGQDGAPGTMLVTVSGAVAVPGVYEVEQGTTIAAALALAEPAGPQGGLLVGGYFGTWLDPAAAAGIPLTPAALRQAGASLGAGVLVALPAGACGIAETARVLAFLADQGAGQCGPCMFGLPAIAGDFADLAAGRAGEAALARLERRLAVIPGRGACRHPDGAVRLASSALTAFAADVHAHARRQPCRAARYGRPARPVLPLPRTAAAERWQ
ncbi:MAG: NADH-ubiquinone oxidoreductase-F iron-sulfur binding region domain-containing protein [Gemmatimonadota bacterium]